MSPDTSRRLRAEYEKRTREWSDLGRHLPYLYQRAAALIEPVIVELGVREGVSTSAFLRAVSEVGGHLHSVDIQHPKVPIWWADTGLWTFYVGDDLDSAILAQLPERADLVFVDTSHFYDQTLGELRTYMPRLAEGGVMLLHDTELHTPPSYSGDPYPVRRAIDDYCAETGRTWSNLEGDSGLGILTS